MHYIFQIIFSDNIITDADIQGQIQVEEATSYTLSLFITF